MGTEFELKYAATPAVQAAVRAAFPGNWQQFAMETVYYDTSDRALSARRFTLRRRLENGKSVCTVKTPAGPEGRGEWECVCDSIEKAVPMLCDLGCPPELAALTAPGLEALCGAEFTRQALLLPLPDCSVELALDIGRVLGGGKAAPLCEIEVELKEGPREAAIGFATALADRFGLVREKKSKFRRAKALAEGE